MNEMNEMDEIDEIDERRLIMEVQKYNVLFNTHHARYCEKKARHKAWMKISSKLGYTTSECSAKWSSMRSVFTNYLTKRRLQRIKRPDTVMRPWRYEREMAFVVPFLRGGLTSEDLAPGMLENDCIEPEYSRISEEDKIQYVSSVPAEPEVPEIEEIDTKPGFNSVPEGTVEVMDLSSANHGQPSEENVQYNNHHQDLGGDEVDMFYLSIAKTVKKLSPVEQAKLRMTICNIVSEAEIRQSEVNDYFKRPSSRLAITSPANYYNN